MQPRARIFEELPRRLRSDEEIPSTDVTIFLMNGKRE
jgi:hypothetical protein